MPMPAEADISLADVWATRDYLLAKLPSAPCPTCGKVWMACNVAVVSLVAGDVSPLVERVGRGVLVYCNSGCGHVPIGHVVPLVD